MKIITSTGNAYPYPTSPADITLAQYVAYCEVQKNEPKEIAELVAVLADYDAIGKELQPYYDKATKAGYHTLEDFLNSGQAKNNVKRFLPSLLQRANEVEEKLAHYYVIMDDVWTAKNLHPHQLRVVQSLMGIMDELTVDELTWLYKKCIAAIQRPEHVEYKKYYLVDGAKYELPDELMRKSTLIEFAETAQYEKGLKQVSNGDASGLISMCAVLLRPEGEPYSEALFEQQVQKFQSLSLQVAYEVDFFLGKLSERFALDLATSTLRTAAREMLSTAE